MPDITLRSTRFGSVPIPDDAVVHFPDGLIGVGGAHFALLAQSDSSPFVWLHSLDDAATAVPLADPWRFHADYEIEVSAEDAERVEIVDLDATAVFVAVRAADRLEDFHLNLRAPILISQGRGHQIVNRASGDVQAPLLAAA
ncbi:MAG TPA: flagellar assembly protein FliW [Solirubrobacteraceae bacterium]|jgi:flagellar assembly factor FliW